jgi:hypothetical protein
VLKSAPLTPFPPLPPPRPSSLGDSRELRTAGGGGGGDVAVRAVAAAGRGVAAKILSVGGVSRDHLKPGEKYVEPLDFLSHPEYSKNEQFMKILEANPVFKPDSKRSAVWSVMPYVCKKVVLQGDSADVGSAGTFVRYIVNETETGEKNLLCLECAKLGKRILVTKAAGSSTTNQSFHLQKNHPEVHRVMQATTADSKLYSNESTKLVREELEKQAVAGRAGADTTLQVMDSFLVKKLSDGARAKHHRNFAMWVLTSNRPVKMLLDEDLRKAVNALNPAYDLLRPNQVLSFRDEFVTLMDRRIMESLKRSREFHTVGTTRFPFVTILWLVLIFPNVPPALQ